MEMRKVENTSISIELGQHSQAEREREGQWQALLQLGNLHNRGIRIWHS